MTNSKNVSLPPSSSWSLFRSALATAKLFGEECAQGKTFLITGPYSGIGVETVKTLLQMKADTIILGGRNAQMQKEFIERLQQEDWYDSTTSVDGSHCIDLSNLASVQAFGHYVKTTYTTIDVLICNAGVMNTPPSLTHNGIESQMGTNVVGHFLLAKSLALLTKRQVWLSSYGHTLRGARRIDIQAIRDFSVDDDNDYDGWLKYQQSKLGNILMAKEFGKRYPALEAVSVHPGTIATPLYRSSSVFSMANMLITMAPSWLSGTATQAFPKTVSQGAATTIFCTLAPRIEQGAYYSNCAVYPESQAARNEQDAAALFEYCEQVTAKFQ